MSEELFKSTEFYFDLRNTKPDIETYQVSPKLIDLIDTGDSPEQVYKKLFELFQKKESEK